MLRPPVILFVFLRFTAYSEIENEPIKRSSAEYTRRVNKNKSMPDIIYTFNNIIE